MPVCSVDFVELVLEGSELLRWSRGLKELRRAARVGHSRHGGLKKYTPYYRDSQEEPLISRNLRQACIALAVENIMRRGRGGRG